MKNSGDCPKVSIITAAFNSERYLADTLNSVFGQTYPNIEYIIVDGASTDRTLAILDKYRTRLAKLISEPDKGVYDAFNKGVRAATGDIIYFLNSDDYFYVDTIVEEAVAIFNDNPAATIVYGKNIFFDEVFGVQYIVEQKYDSEKLPLGEFPYHPACFVKKELFVKHGPFDMKYRIASDYDFLLKCFLSDGNRSVFFDRVVSMFRLGGLSNNPKTRKLTIDETNQILRNYFGDKAVNLELSDCTYRNRELHELLRAWVRLLLDGQALTRDLAKRGIKRVAIFGTLHTAILLLKDCQRSNIEVAGFLDNNQAVWGAAIKGVKAYAPSWLKENAENIDCIILSNESETSLATVKGHLAKIVPADKLVTWKELLLASW